MSSDLFYLVLHKTCGVRHPETLKERFGTSADNAKVYLVPLDKAQAERRHATDEKWYKWHRGCIYIKKNTPISVTDLTIEALFPGPISRGVSSAGVWTPTQSLLRQHLPFFHTSFIDFLLLPLCLLLHLHLLLFCLSASFLSALVFFPCFIHTSSERRSVRMRGVKDESIQV